MEIHQSAEDYLEAIFVVQKQKGKARVLDVAEYLGFSKPSVSIATGKLRDNGYLDAESSSLELTDAGLKVAQKTYERHQFFREWLIKIGVDPETAEKDACRIEHVVSDETFDHIKRAISEQND